MATLSDLAKQYAMYIRLNQDNPSAVSEIVSRINSLTYTESGRSISGADRDKLFVEIEETLSKPQVTKDGYLLKEAEDSSALLALVQMIRQKSNEGKKQ